MALLAGAQKVTRAQLVAGAAGALRLADLALDLRGDVFGDKAGGRVMFHDPAIAVDFRRAAALGGSRRDAHNGLGRRRQGHFRRGPVGVAGG